MKGQNKSEKKIDRILNLSLEGCLKRHREIGCYGCDGNPAKLEELRGRFTNPSTIDIEVRDCWKLENLKIIFEM